MIPKSYQTSVPFQIKKKLENKETNKMLKRKNKFKS